MKQKYRVIGAMLVALVTAFISVQGVGNVIDGNASPEININHGERIIPNQGNTDISSEEKTPGKKNTDSPKEEETSNTKNTDESKVVPTKENGESKTEPTKGTPSNAESSTIVPESTLGETVYDEWKIIKEPSYTEEGLKQRRGIKPDGTVVTETEIIPKLIKPTEPSSSDNNNIATNSNTKPRYNGRSGGKKSKSKSNFVDITVVSEEEIASQSDILSNFNQTETKEEAFNPSPDKVKDKTSKDNKKSTKSNNIARSVKITAETLPESEGKNEVRETMKKSGHLLEAVENNKDSSEIDVKTAEIVKPKESFNKYDGVTLLAVGAYAWWIAIVLFPMVNAVKWINNKRREKLAGKKQC